MSKYTDLITSEHADQPLYMAMVQLVTDAWVDNQTVLGQINDAFDLDLAVGAQLDVCGQWIGLGRAVQVPISGVYFSFDIDGVGWDQGIWWSPGNALFTTVIMADEVYRRALQAKALANRWDGSLFGAYHVYAVLFNGTRTSVVIHDYQNMSFAVEIVGVIPDDATLALISQDYLGLRPEGVRQMSNILP